MPLNISARVGYAGATRNMVGLLDQVNLTVPPRVQEAITAWQTLTAALARYAVPAVEPVEQAVVVALIRAASTGELDVDKAVGSKLHEQQGKHDRAETRKRLLTQAAGDAAIGVVRAANTDQGSLIAAAQTRYAELVSRLIPAAEALPADFSERDALYAADDLREHWTTAHRAWTEALALRQLVSSFDSYRNLDQGWAKVAWTKSARVADATPFRSAFAAGQCSFGEPGSMVFALNLARACSADPVELWLPTAQQASALATQLWPARNTA